jgi:hypothetical protein
MSEQTPEQQYFGPDADLIWRMDRLLAVDPKLLPAEFSGLSDEEQRAAVDRIIAAGTWRRLEERDQRLLDAAALVYSAGGAPAILAPATVGDWQAEDSAIDNEGGRVPVRPLREDALTSEDRAELRMYEDDSDVPEADAEGWVGL